MSKRLLSPSELDLFDRVMDNWALAPPTLTGGECQPASVVVPRLVLKNGRPVETLVRIGTPESGSKAFIDQLTFVFHRSTISRLTGTKYDMDAAYDVPQDWDECALVMSYYLEHIFGFGITANRHKKANFYSNSYQLGTDQCNYGLFMIGGNKKTVCVEFTATGLSAAKDGWEHRLYQFATSEKVDHFRFTRVDVARDFFKGEYTIERALQSYYAGEFTLSVTRPQLRKEGADWYNDTQKGRTLYVGTRESSRLTRIYEKGKQLGDPESEWVRAETEFRSKDLVIPFDILLHPGDYLSTFPAFQIAEFACLAPKKVEAKRRTIQSGIDHAIKYLRIQGSKAVKLLLEHGKTAEEILKVFDPEAKIPDRTHPGRYFCQLLGISYLHQDPDVIPV